MQNKEASSKHCLTLGRYLRICAELCTWSRPPKYQVRLPLSKEPFSAPFLSRVLTEGPRLALLQLDAEQRLESLSLHLLCLAAWREAITVCHAWAETLDGDEADASAPPFPDSSLPGSLSSQRMLFDGGPEAACASVEREFLLAVERAEGVAQDVGAEREAEVPDAMELVFQAALAVGRAGAVSRCKGQSEAGCLIGQLDVFC
jgi:serine/threonine-protein kinase ULK/ATG1